jgi:hypothetical protein
MNSFVVYGLCVSFWVFGMFSRDIGSFLYSFIVRLMYGKDKEVSDD